MTSTPEHARLETRSVQSPVWARNKELPQPIRAKIDGGMSGLWILLPGGQNGQITHGESAMLAMFVENHVEALTDRL